MTIEEPLKTVALQTSEVQEFKKQLSTFIEPVVVLSAT